MDKRFEIISSELLSTMRMVTILKDKQTGVHYLYYGSGSGGGLTPLLDKNG